MPLCMPPPFVMGSVKLWHVKLSASKFVFKFVFQQNWSLMAYKKQTNCYGRNWMGAGRYALGAKASQYPHIDWNSVIETIKFIYCMYLWIMYVSMLSRYKTYWTHYGLIIQSHTPCSWWCTSSSTTCGTHEWWCTYMLYDDDELVWWTFGSFICS